jgi:hypothetical protein
MKDILEQIFTVEEVKQGKVQIRVRGDVSVHMDTLEIFTSSGDMCIDTLNGTLQLNGRMGPSLRNLPESIEYRENNNKRAREARSSHTHECPKQRQLDAIIEALRNSNIPVEVDNAWNRAIDR